VKKAASAATTAVKNKLPTLSQSKPPAKDPSKKYNSAGNEIHVVKGPFKRKK